MAPGDAMVTPWDQTAMMMRCDAMMMMSREQGRHRPLLLQPRRRLAEEGGRLAAAPALVVLQQRAQAGGGVCGGGLGEDEVAVRLDRRPLRRREPVGAVVLRRQLHRRHLHRRQHGVLHRPARRELGHGLLVARVGGVAEVAAQSLAVAGPLVGLPVEQSESSLAGCAVATAAAEE